MLSENPDGKNNVCSNFKPIIMATEDKLARETTIYVSTSSTLNLEQTQNITNELLRIIGYPNNYSEFKFHFIEEGMLIQAHAYVDSELRVFINN